jgi:hypothetical protein
LKEFRKVMGVAVPIVGMILVFTAILVPAISMNLPLQVFVVLAGLLILETGVWKLTERLLPSTRTHLALRTEVDQFIDQIRVLNVQGENLMMHETETPKKAFRKTLESLHQSVDRMGQVAGRPL